MDTTVVRYDRCYPLPDYLNHTRVILDPRSNQAVFDAALTFLMDNYSGVSASSNGSFLDTSFHVYTMLAEALAANKGNSDRVRILTELLRDQDAAKIAHILNLLICVDNKHPNHTEAQLAQKMADAVYLIGRLSSEQGYLFPTTAVSPRELLVKMAMHLSTHATLRQQLEEDPEGNVILTLLASKLPGIIGTSIARGREMPNLSNDGPTLIETPRRNGTTQTWPPRSHAAQASTLRRTLVRAVR